VIDDPVFTGELVIPPGARNQPKKRAGPLKFPPARVEVSPARILVARGQPVAADAETAIRRAIAARAQLDECGLGDSAPVIAKPGRARAARAPRRKTSQDS
jgi:hypothetical protein